MDMRAIIVLGLLSACKLPATVVGSDGKAESLGEYTIQMCGPVPLPYIGSDAATNPDALLRAQDKFVSWTYCVGSL